MISTLRYGADSSLSFDVATDALLAHCAAPRGEPLVRVGEAVERALAEPLEFPPLAQAALPGDKVVLALGEAVPQAATIIARTVAVLLEAGVSASDVTILRTIEDAAIDPLAELDPVTRGLVVALTHDPANRGSLSYLAASTAGEPIYINRAIHDADLVITIGSLRVEATPGYFGVPAAVFPTFSDEASQNRFRSLRADEPRERRRLRQAVDEVTWLLGLHFTIQVVPGAGDTALHVLAGELDAVFREGSRRCNDAWSYSIPKRANLVVATIEGGAGEQTWNNVARALAAASHAGDRDGAVAICCGLSAPIGPGMQRVAGADDLGAALRDIGRHQPCDAWAAAELVRTLQQRKVYFLSQLDEDLVEDLGMVPLAAEQLSRLAARYDTCIVLSNAQRAWAQAADEPAELAPTGKSPSPP
jgi:nickel-dependent lactate racemase